MEANIITCDSNKIELPRIETVIRYDENTAILADHVKHEFDYYTENFITLDISNPLNIKITGNLQLKTHIKNDHVFVHNKYLFNRKIYCCDNNNKIIVFNASNSHKITEEKTILLNGKIHTFTVSSEREIYAISGEGRVGEIVRVDDNGIFTIISDIKINSNVKGIGLYGDLLLAAGWQHGLSLFRFNSDKTLNLLKTVDRPSSVQMPAKILVFDNKYYVGTDFFNNIMAVDIAVPENAKRLNILKNNRVRMFMDSIMEWDNTLIVYGNGDNKRELLFVTLNEKKPEFRETIKLKGKFSKVIMKDNYLINFFEGHIETIELKK
jgi:hypothetical protein